MFLKRFGFLIALVLGSVGTIIWLAVIVLIWMADVRLERATGRIFATVDNTIVGVQQRVVQAKQRMQELKLTTEEIEQHVTQWAKAEGRERITKQLGIQEKAEKVAAGLERADNLLENMEASVQMVQQVLAAGDALGISIPPDSTQSIAEGIELSRERLREVTEPVERIQQYAASAEKLEIGVQDALQISIRVLATLNTLDTRFDALEEHLQTLQIRAQSARTTVLWWIRMAALVITSLLGWMTAGQVALGYFGWVGIRNRAS